MLTVSGEQQKQIEEWWRLSGTPQQVALRSRIVLAAGLGKSEAAIAAEMNVNRKAVHLWRERFAEQGLPPLWEIAPGSWPHGNVQSETGQSRDRRYFTLQAPRDESLELPTLAAQQGLSKSTVNNLWHGHNIKPHRTKKFKLSRDPKFLQKLTDVVSLYLNPPDQAIVLCIDERAKFRL